MSKKFTSFGDFGRYMGDRPWELAGAKIRALEDIGQVVVEATQAKHGQYQDAFGKFPGWAELSAFTKIERRLLGFTENQPLFRTGELAGSYRAVVTGGVSVTVGSPLPKAADMEFGTDNVSARPAVGPAMAEEQFRNELRMKQALKEAFS